MDIGELIDGIAAMTADDIRRVAVGIDDHHRSAADEVGWWQATLGIDRALRTSGRTREAGMAATNASKAVQAVARAGGLCLPDPAVTAVARAAGELARAIVAGDAAGAELRVLLDAWAGVVAVPVGMRRSA
jgi:hypothetical protein